MAYFPLTGLVAGCLTAGLDWTVKGIWPPAVAGVVAVTFLAFLTRGLHLDGLADTADAVASGADREKALEIMRDSANGALGILTMLLVLLVKCTCAVQLSLTASWQWFVIIPCFSRTGLVVLAAVSRYARSSGGLGALFTGKGSRQALFIAIPTAAAASWALNGLTGIALLACVIVLSLAVAAWSRNRFGGVTGDILGAHVELQEALLFLVATALVRQL